MSIKDQIKKSEGSDHKKRSLFGRRQGRALKGDRADAMQTIFPKLKLDETILTEKHTLSPENLLGKNYDSYWLEIGFGHGERLAALAQQNPKTGYLGAEPFVNGMAAFVKDMDTPLLENVKVLMDDGMILANSIKPSSLDGIYILNPDPWHKTRHHKRRIINHKNLDIFAKILKPKGKLILTTDVEDLANWMLTHTVTHTQFKWLANYKQDWSSAPDDWVTTRYETKGAKGAKKMAYLHFEKHTE